MAFLVSHNMQEKFEIVRNKENCIKSLAVSAIVSNAKQKRWASTDELKEDFVEAFNSEFPEGYDPHYVRRTPTYTQVICKYGCDFSMWFTEDEAGLVKFYRNVNTYHFIDKHEKGKEKDMSDAI